MNRKNTHATRSLDNTKGKTKDGSTPSKCQSFSFNQINAVSPKKEKAIEIVIASKFANTLVQQKNVAIQFDEELILEIISSHYQNTTVTEIKTLNDLKELAARKPDLVFSGVKYFHFDGTEIWLNDYLDSHHIAYIASNRKALNTEHDKSCAKNAIQRAGIATADYFTTAPGEHPIEASIPIAFPLFVKPLTGGDSKGVDTNSIVNNFLSFQAKVADIYQAQGSRSLVETYLPGKEYSVGIFEDSSNGKLTAMPIEIIAGKNKNGERILDFDIKKNNSEKVIAVTDKKIHEQLSNLAKDAFKALGGRAIGRIDIKMNQNYIPHFIEANLMPGLRTGYFYRACVFNLNMSYEQMILRVVDNSLPIRYFVA